MSSKACDEDMTVEQDSTGVHQETIAIVVLSQSQILNCAVYADGDNNVNVADPSTATPNSVAGPVPWPPPHKHSFLLNTTSHFHHFSFFTFHLLKFLSNSLLKSKTKSFILKWIWKRSLFFWWSKGYNVLSST